MISDTDQRPCAQNLRKYETLVRAMHPTYAASWPLVNGWNLLTAEFNGWTVILFQDAGFSSITKHDGISIDETIVGVPQITEENRAYVRARLERHFNIKNRDAIFLWPPNNDCRLEYEAMLFRHERAMGLVPMKIFLSHKGIDKSHVRDFAETLALLGFEPWLDEEAMPAGTPLHRGIQRGFSDSCAAVFFVTTNFKDEAYLATEVDYAVAENTKRSNQFAIITLVLSYLESKDQKATVPDLLHRYVWKEPRTPLEALREIVRALPICLGEVHPR